MRVFSKAKTATPTGQKQDIFAKPPEPMQDKNATDFPSPENIAEHPAGQKQNSFENVRNTSRNALVDKNGMQADLRSLADTATSDRANSRKSC